MADNSSKNMNCKKSVKQNRNPIRLCILPFYTIIFTAMFKSIQIVGWFGQNHRAANPARELHIIWQRPLFSLPPSHHSPCALFFFLPSLPTIQSGLRGEESFIIVACRVACEQQAYFWSSLLSLCYFSEPCFSELLLLL